MLPVVAMTDNAQQQDRDLCLAAGMNDLVAKPIEPRQLLAALQQWIVPQKRAAVVVEQHAEHPEQAIKQGRAQEEVAQLVQQVGQGLAALLQELREKLPPEQGSLPIAVDPRQLDEVCSQLAELLRHDDLNAAKLFEKHAALLKTAFPAEFTNLETAISQFEYETALAALERLTSENKQWQLIGSIPDSTKKNQRSRVITRS